MIDFTCPDWLSFLACDGPSRWDDIEEFLKDYEREKLINPEFSYLPLEEMDWRDIEMIPSKSDVNFDFSY